MMWVWVIEKRACEAMVRAAQQCYQSLKIPLRDDTFIYAASTILYAI